MQTSLTRRPPRPPKAAWASLARTQERAEGSALKCVTRRRATRTPRGAPTPSLGRLGDLVGLQTASADVGAERATVLLDPDLLQVRLEAALRRDHRVAAGLAEGRLLAAAVTYLCHRTR